MSGQCMFGSCGFLSAPAGCLDRASAVSDNQSNHSSSMPCLVEWGKIGIECRPDNKASWCDPNRQPRVPLWSRLVHTIAE